MTEILKNLFPGGTRKALTTSFDDMVLQDRKLIEIFKEYGIKGTFNLNSGWFGKQDRLIRNGIDVDHTHFNKDEIKKIYKDHEVAVHTVNHANLKAADDEKLLQETIDDRKALEEVVGYPVRGMAYPNGTYDERVIRLLEKTGIEYARTVIARNTFSKPDRFLEWKTTCRQRSEKIDELSLDFISAPANGNGDMMLFYIWGHSYEMDIDNSWDKVKNFYKKIGRQSDIWYATNIEIFDYLNALDNIKISVEGTYIYNPSAIDIWLTCNGKAIIIPGGEMVIT